MASDDEAQGNSYKQCSRTSGKWRCTNEALPCRKLCRHHSDHGKRQAAKKRERLGSAGPAAGAGGEAAVGTAISTRAKRSAAAPAQPRPPSARRIKLEADAATADPDPDPVAPTPVLDPVALSDAITFAPSAAMSRGASLAGGWPRVLPLITPQAARAIDGGLALSGLSGDPGTFRTDARTGSDALLTWPGGGPLSPLMENQLLMAPTGPIQPGGGSGWGAGTVGGGAGGSDHSGVSQPALNLKLGGPGGQPAAGHHLNVLGLHLSRVRENVLQARVATLERENAELRQRLTGSSRHEARSRPALSEGGRPAFSAWPGAARNGNGNGNGISNGNGNGNGSGNGNGNGATNMPPPMPSTFRSADQTPVAVGETSAAPALGLRLDMSFFASGAPAGPDQLIGGSSSGIKPSKTAEIVNICKSSPAGVSEGPCLLASTGDHEK